MSGSFALIVASDRYDDPALRQLRGPAKEAEALATTLADPAIGGFQVRTLVNQAAHLVTEEIEAFFDDRLRDDLLLLYLSCHGIKDDSGRLYFASTSTKLNRLAATGISSVFVNERMDQSRSRKIVLLLDCCYSGAFARGMVPRASETVDIQERFEGRGRAVVTASTAMEYAFETDSGSVSGSGTPSLFTRAVLDGLRTGDADLDGDGRVSVDELYDYVFRIVREATPDQTPSMIGNLQGELYIARSPRTGPGPPAARSDPAPSPSRSMPWAPLRGRTALAVAAASALCLLIVLVAVLLSRPSATDTDPSNTADGVTPGGSQSPPTATVSTSPALTDGVLSQGETRLADPTTGLDLQSGQVVSLLVSQLAWNGSAELLFVFDETTLGAVVLADGRFADVTPAQLAAASYRRGDANPPLSPADLPPAAVLAVHLADGQYAKVTVVRYEPGGDLLLRWVAYRVM